MHTLNTAEMTQYWHTDKRWRGTTPLHQQQVDEAYEAPFQVEHTLARMGAERLWWLSSMKYVPALGALTGNQAVQQVRPG